MYRKKLPLYSSETIWQVDNQGLLSVVVGGVTYGDGEQVEAEGEEIVESDNPMLNINLYPV